MIPIALAITLSSPLLKVRVDGEGYLRFIRDGRAVYAKEAALQISGGKLADAAGDPVLPAIEVGSDTIELAIDLEGNVFATAHGAKVKAGQLVLADFPATEAFQTQDVVLIADDRPKLGSPGDEAFGVIRLVPGFDAPSQKISISPDSPKKPESHPGFIVPDPLAHEFSAKPSIPSGKPGIKLGKSGSGLQITVQEHTVVEGDHILLSDIAQLDGDPSLIQRAAPLELADTPPTGLRRVIDRSRIYGRLRQAGIALNEINLSIPDVVEVRRKGQMIPNSKFVLTATQALMSKGGLSGTWQSTDSFADLEVPSGNVDLRAEQVIGEDTGNASIVVAIYVDGSRYNSRTVHLHLKDNVPPVQPGSAVKVILYAGHAEVEVSGIARSMGRMGQAIQVEVQVGNPPVKSMHTGIVSGPGTVEVKL